MFFLLLRDGLEMEIRKYQVCKILLIFREHADSLVSTLPRGLGTAYGGKAARPQRPRGPPFRKCISRKCIFRKFCKFLTGSFSAVSTRNFATKYAVDNILLLFKICTLLHRCNLNFLAKKRFEKSAILVKIQQKICKCRKICEMLTNFKNFNICKILLNFEFSRKLLFFKPLFC